jgi:hypothetical protein
MKTCICAATKHSPQHEYGVWGVYSTRNSAFQRVWRTLQLFIVPLAANPLVDLARVLFKQFRGRPWVSSSACLSLFTYIAAHSMVNALT